ncbi:MAG TPA: hypothetical protein VI796_05770 [Candidatus Thermoplasmatota archaeon]|nr:hypothetical protein [Candidatus Thermoplasmatota archaeon]
MGYHVQARGAGLRRTAIRAAAIGLALLLPLLSGCAGNGTLRATEGNPCPDRTAGHCETTDREVVVRDLLLRGSKGHVGLILEPKEKAVVLENVTLQGFGLGVLVQLEGCGTCRVEMRNVVIDNARVGIAIAGGEGDIVLEDVSIITLGGGEVRRLTMPDAEGNLTQEVPLYLNESYGLSILDDSPGLALTVKDSRIFTHIPGLGVAMEGEVPLARLDIHGLEISGYRIGIELHPASADFRRLTIGCIDEGAVLGTAFPNMAAFRGEDIQIIGCTGPNLGLASFKSVHLRGLHVRGGTYGVYERAEDLLIEGFKIEDAGYGILTDDLGFGGSSASYLNGIVSNATYAGIAAHHRQVVVENVTFRNNGRGWPDPNAWKFEDAPDDPTKYGGLVMRHEFLADNFQLAVDQVHGCSFEGNLPYGMVSLEPTDATLNWWGSSDGPHVYYFDPAERVPSFSLGGHGDNVTAYATVVAPFLSTPP